MACQKVCKQGRDDVIVKVNLQSSIPTSFYITVANYCENDAGMKLCSGLTHFIWTTIVFTIKLSADFVPTELTCM